MERRLLGVGRLLHPGDDRLQIGHRHVHDDIVWIVHDNPLVAGSTPIKAIHLTELRLAIDQARSRRALAPFSWIDPVIVPGVTPVRAVHIAQMRTALSQAYQAAGRTRPTYSEPSLIAGQTSIRAAHIAELRAAVLALQ